MTIPTTTMTNQMIDNTNLKIFFIILILQTDFDIFLSGRISLPGVYWILSITILMTAMRVPISRASCVSARTTFISLPIFLSDRLSALIKCVEEENSGNREFAGARRQQSEALAAMHCPEADYFIEHMLPCYDWTLDELSAGKAHSPAHDS